MSTAVSESAHENHNISLRVLRLSKALLASHSVYSIGHHPRRLGPALQETSFESAAKTPPTNQGFNSSISSLLLLPSSFGNIYLGETLSVALLLNNDCLSGSLPIQDVGVKAELQTATQRITLMDTTNAPLPDTLSGSSVEFVLQQDIRELGMHILVVQVAYTYTHSTIPVPSLSSQNSSAPFSGLTAPTSAYTANYSSSGNPGASMLRSGVGMSERKSLRKYYKFHVLNPLVVKTRVTCVGMHTTARVGFTDKIENVPAIAHAYGTVLLEVQLTNAMTNGGGMILDTMVFQPVDGLECLDMSTIPPTPISATPPPATPPLVATGPVPLVDFNSGSPTNDTQKQGESSMFTTPIFQSAYLNADDIRQHLYLFRPTANASAILASNNIALGKLDIAWSTTSCETGRLQTSQLVRKVNPTPPEILIMPVKASSNSNDNFSILRNIPHTTPDVALFERPFDVRLRVYNRTSMHLKLQIVFPSNGIGNLSTTGNHLNASMSNISAATSLPSTLSTRASNAAALKRQASQTSVTDQPTQQKIQYCHYLSVVGAHTIPIGDVSKGEFRDFSVRCIAFARAVNSGDDPHDATPNTSLEESSQATALAPDNAASVIAATECLNDSANALYRMPLLKVVEITTGIIREVDPHVEVFIVSHLENTPHITIKSTPPLLLPNIDTMTMQSLSIPLLERSMPLQQADIRTEYPREINKNQLGPLMDQDVPATSARTDILLTPVNYSDTTTNIVPSATAADHESSIALGNTEQQPLPEANGLV